MIASVGDVEIARLVNVHAFRTSDLSQRSGNSISVVTRLSDTNNSGDGARSIERVDFANAMISEIGNVKIACGIDRHIGWAAQLRLGCGNIVAVVGLNTISRQTISRNDDLLAADKINSPNDVPARIGDVEITVAH